MRRARKGNKLLKEEKEKKKTHNLAESQNNHTK
jgi:hypothetical protein